MAGYVSSGSLSSVGSVAFFYGSDQLSTNSSYYLSIRTQGQESPQLTADGRLSEGMNVRCVAL